MELRVWWKTRLGQVGWEQHTVTCTVGSIWHILTYFQISFKYFEFQNTFSDIEIIEIWKSHRSALQTPLPTVTGQKWSRMVMEWWFKGDLVRIIRIWVCLKIGGCTHANCHHFMMCFFFFGFNPFFHGGIPCFSDKPIQ